MKENCEKVQDVDIAIQQKRISKVLDLLTQ